MLGSDGGALGLYGGRHLEGTWSVLFILLSCIRKCYLMMLMGAAETNISLKSWGVPQTGFPFVIAFVIQVKGCQSLLIAGRWGSLRSPSCQATQPSCSPVRLPPLSLASDRNLELNGLGINCLNAFVQISSLTSYLKCFLKYTGALCKLLYKLWSPLFLLSAASVSNLSNVYLAPGQGWVLETGVSGRAAHRSH